jgi:hypothetical protein
MAKILLLGSSYSTGSYVLDNDGIEHWKSHVSYYDVLGEEHEVDVWCGANFGYMNYVDILSNRVGAIPPYDLVIIQECLEPKIQFHEPDQVWLSRKRGSVTKNYLSHKSIVFSNAVDLSEIMPSDHNIAYNSDFITWKDKIVQGGQSSMIPQSSCLMLNTTLQQAGVPGYILCMGTEWEHGDKDQLSKWNFHNKYLEMPTFAQFGYDIFKKDPTYVNFRPGGQKMAHYTKAGNYEIGQVLLNEIRQILDSKEK